MDGRSESAFTPEDAPARPGDKSKNGKTWRLNTPEFNNVEITSDGFIIKGPDGASLKATFFNGKADKNITTTALRYGGDTQENVSGIGFHGRYYANTTAIDCKCNGNIIVVFSIQPKGKEHPDVVFRNKKLLVGGLEIVQEE
ncbi:MAG: hypothetical protein HC830_13110 [Bacteroidetes bacterium]|nr:hypothetical protein [Bacteroidota bacterium]